MTPEDKFATSKTVGEVIYCFYRRRQNARQFFEGMGESLHMRIILSVGI